MRGGGGSGPLPPPPPPPPRGGGARRRAPPPPAGGGRGAGTGEELPEGGQQVVVGEQVGQRVVAGEDGVELPAVVPGEPAQVGDGEVDVQGAPGGLAPGARDGGGGEVGGGDAVAQRGQAE